MRNNQPVVDHEFPFPPGETLVSTTDLKGRILYCNPAFIALSGFAKEELLGQPHNIVRHPDMPPEAYRDMWATIARGLPWSAPVKNRRKDGRHYWVMANVTPLIEAGVPVGYMSVRTEPSREQVAVAERLYAQMRAQAATGTQRTRLREGAVEMQGPRAQFRRLFQVGLRSHLAWACGLLCGASAAAAAAVSAPAFVPLQLLTVAVAGTGVGAACGAWLLGSLAAGPVERYVDIANRMAAGDLTQRVPVHGHGSFARLGKALSQLSVNLRSIVRDARKEVEHMRDATREIAAGNQDLSARTESQAASLQQTASSMEQITSTVRHSAAAAGQAAQLAGQARDVTERGSRAMHEVTRTMHTISDASRRIGEIIGTIDGIAFQTNILALNAAVEAARAGEQGRGFAVVAAEVRSLAQRTTGAAREIKQLNQDSAQKVEAGNRLTEEAQKTMDGALDMVQRVSHVIEEISTGTSEQLSGISQVNEAVSQMDGITQQNAALVEQIAASAVQLQGQAAAVSEAVQVFKLDTNATARSTQSGPDAVALRRQRSPDHGQQADQQPTESALT